MDLSSVKAQDLAVELIRRAKAGWEEKINVGFIILTAIDALKTPKFEDGNDYLSDAEEFIENAIDLMGNELAHTDPDKPILSAYRVSEWAQL